MNEHVHEWVWIYRVGGAGPRYIGCSQCGEPMNSDEQMRRINATEALSAENARYFAEHTVMIALHGYLLDYANILEGKDE